MIDWDILGLKVIGECYSGTSVLKMIETEHPDIVITDICMPGCDGLEMINRANNLGIPCEYILISGHKNFEYAHTAVKYGIRNYLLKPINQDELYENLSVVKNRILNSYCSEKENVHLWERTKKNEKLSKLCFMQNFIKGSLSIKGLKDINKYYLTNFKDGTFFMLIIKPDIKGKLKNDQYNIILEQVDEYFNRHLKSSCVEIVSMIEKQLYLLINVLKDINVDIILADVFENAKIRFGDHCMLTIGVSGKYNFTKFGIIEEANIALSTRLDRGTNCIINYNTITPVKTGKRFFSDPVLKILADHIEVANQQASKLWFKEQRQSISQNITALEYINSIYMLIDYIDVVLKKLFKSNMDFQKQELHESIIHELSRVNMLNSVEHWLNNNLQIYISKKEAQKLWYVRMSKKYISENYTNNISLNDIATQLHINSSYFSMLFKKEEGINFVEYLTKYRMNLAKNFLKEPDYSIAQVGYMVGYDDSSYFSKMFNKVVGIRPKEYRKLYL